MVDYLSSSIQVIEESPSVRTLPVTQTAVPGLVGLAERGPLDSPTLVASYDEFKNIFGDARLGEYSNLAVQNFFLNGGSQLVFVRVLGAAPVTATLDVSTDPYPITSGAVTGTVVAPFDLVPNDNLKVAVDGGSAVTATFTATQAVLTSGDETYALVDGDTLGLTIDGGTEQVFTFLTADFVSIGAATASEVQAVIDATLTGAVCATAGLGFTVTSDSYGTDSHVVVSSGSAVTALGFTLSQDAPGTGNVANIDSVTIAEVKAVVEGAVSGVTVSDDGNGHVVITSDTTGSTSSVQLTASDVIDITGAHAVMGLDTSLHVGSDGTAEPTLTIDASSPGEWGNGVTVVFSAPSNGIVTGSDAAFNMHVYKDGVLVEPYANLNMNPDSAAYVVDVINSDSSGSNYIHLTNLDAIHDAPHNRPTYGTYALVTGDDGGALSDSTFTGGLDSGAGLNTLEAVEISLLMSPDWSTAAMHNAMIDFCEGVKNNAVFAVLDTPAGLERDDIVTHVRSLTKSEVAALYWPRVKIVNPNKAVFGTDAAIVVPASGCICGTMARIDANTLAGAFSQPAGSDSARLVGVVGIENASVLRKSTRDVIYPERINPLRSPERGGSVYIDGSRTLKSDGNFPSIGERRGVSFVETTLKYGLDFVRHKSNTEELRRQVERIISGFMLGLTQNGALASRDPVKAFVVDADIPGVGINNANARLNGRLFVRLSIATAKPAEFIVILVSQDTRALENS